MSLKQTVAPTTYPVTLDELKSHLRITGGFEDDALTIYRDAAVRQVENWQKRQLINATYEYKLDYFPSGDITIPMPPLSSITSIQYIDTDGNAQTWSSSEYEVDTDSVFGRVHTLPGYTRPTAINDRLDVMTITFVAGYGTATTDIPQSTRLAILLLAAHWYERREPVSEVALKEVPFQLQNLINEEAIKEFA